MVAAKLQFIAPLKLAEKQERLTGSVPVSSLHRLRDILYNDKGSVNFDLQFGKDDRGQAIIRGIFDCTLNLTCQRCMQPMELSIGNRISLAVAGSDNGDIPSEEYEPLTLVDNQIALETLLEQEVLLAMPIAPVHDRSKCSGSNLVDKYKASIESPFAVLKNLKIEK